MVLGRTPEGYCMYQNIPSEYTNTIPRAQSNKGLPFGNPLFYLAEA